MHPIDFFHGDLGRVVFYLMVGLAGMICHYLKKWADHEIDGSFFGYFGYDHGRRTVLALFAFGSAASAELATNLLNGMGLLAIALMAWKTGWISDTLNKGRAPPVAPPKP